MKNPFDNGFTPSSEDEWALSLLQFVEDVERRAKRRTEIYYDEVEKLTTAVRTLLGRK